MNLNNGKTEELWGEISSIIDAGEDYHRWMFHSTSDRLLVAVKLPLEGNLGFNVSRFDERVKIVSLNSSTKFSRSLDVNIVRTVITTQWGVSSRVQLIGAWEGEDNVLVVATQHRKEEKWILRVGAYDITNGEFLHGITSTNRHIKLPLRVSPFKRYLPFVFNPKNNQFRYPTFTAKPDCYGYTHTLFLHTYSMPREKFKRKQAWCTVKKKVSYRTPHVSYDIRMESKGSKTYIYESKDLYTDSGDGRTCTKIDDLLVERAITSLGDQILVINGNGYSFILDAKNKVRMIELVHDDAPVERIVAAGRTLIIQQPVVGAGADSFFAKEPITGTITRAYTWIK